MKQWKGITKKLFSAVLALALVATILPANVMAAQGTPDTPDVTWTSADINGMVESGTAVKGIKAQTDAPDYNMLYTASGSGYITISTFMSASPWLFSDTLGRKISKIVLHLPDGSGTTFTAGGWQYASNNTEFVWEGAEPADSVPLAASDIFSATSINATSIDFYLVDARTEPTADNFTYDSSTGLVSAQSGLDLGTVTTYYKVNDAWTTEKPTEVGTYEVGVVTVGNATYKDLGTAAEPFTASWIYEVKAAEPASGNLDNGAAVADNSKATAATTDTASTKTASPKTGDATSGALYLVVLMAGIAGCAGGALRRRKNNI